MEDNNFLLVTFLLTLGIQLFFFFIAYTFQVDKVTDISGTMNFVLLAWYTFFSSGTYFPRQVVALILLNIWAFRLGLFLLYRVLKRGKDERFDEMRQKFWSFLAFWIFQMFWVWVVSLPVTFLFGAKVDRSLNGRDYIGYICWAIGFVFESLADQTKHIFNSNPENKGKLLKSNVWYFSRHPNYFGEIMIWLGMFLTSSTVYSANTNWAYFSVMSPVITYLLLMFLSGVPLAEKRYDKRFASDPSYWDYKNQTSVLIPCPPSLYCQFSSSVKCLLWCEYSFYTSKPPLSSSKRKLQ